MNKSKILFAWGSFSKQIDFLYPVLILFVAGCGYSIMGGNPPLPMEAKSIGIQPVENHTFVAGLDTKTNAEIKNLLETNASVETGQTQQKLRPEQVPFKDLESLFVK